MTKLMNHFTVKDLMAKFDTPHAVAYAIVQVMEHFKLATKLVDEKGKLVTEKSTESAKRGANIYVVNDYGMRFLGGLSHDGGISAAEFYGKLATG